MSRWPWFTALGALLSTGVLASCGQVSAVQIRHPGAPAAVVSTTPASTGSIAATLTYAGTIIANQQVNLVPKTAGVITKFYVSPGATVRAGQLIAQLDDSTQQAQLQQAQAALAAAQANLAKVEQGPTAAEIGVAKAGENTAAAAVTNAERALTAAQHQATADAASGAQAVANAQAALNAAAHVYAVTSGNQGTEQAAIQSAQQQVGTAQAKLAQVQGSESPTQIALEAAQTAYASAQRSLAAVQATQTSTLAADQQNIQKAKDALFAAQTTRDGVCGNRQAPAYECQSQNATVDAAQTAVTQANLQYQQAQQQAQQAVLTAQDQVNSALAQVKSAGAAQIAAVQSAQQAVQTAQQQLTSTQAAASQGLASGQTAVVTAQNQLKTAQAALTQTAARDAATVTQAENAVNSAAAQVQSAQANYASVTAPATPAAIATAKAQVQNAQAQIVTAQTALNQTKIIAPSAGILASQLLQVGALATPTSPVGTFVSSGVQVDVNVEQANAAQVSVGQPVTLTVSAYPGVTFPARVTQVSPVAVATSHVFPTIITPQPADPRLKPGMFVTVAITTEQVSGATLVPRVAVLSTNGQDTVYTVKNGHAIAVPVKLGLTTAAEAQIVSGVTSGEPVVILGQTSLTSGQPVIVSPTPAKNTTTTSTATTATKSTTSKAAHGHAKKGKRHKGTPAPQGQVAPNQGHSQWV
ncbi:MAG: efflux RND transporter periplasmic adaptor subunit [Chloroflexi bacterium]|nr:efflux RND transporter periplasmic adaptor subunit [Chloroflexota bacterium]